jgi:hypothetical protein
MPWYIEIAKEYLIPTSFWKTIPSYLDIEWIQIEKRMWDFVYHPPP